MKIQNKNTGGKISYILVRPSLSLYYKVELWYNNNQKEKKNYILWRPEKNTLPAKASNAKAIVWILKI